MMEPFKWGIIGPGRIAGKFAEDLKSVEEAELHAVASRSGDSQLAKKFNVPVQYRSYEDLAGDPDVDAVYIATPHSFHLEAGQICLEAGMPVLIEKPLTINAAQTKSLIDLAHQRQVFLMEAMWSRFLPVHQQIRSWLDEGLIGKIQSVQASFGFLHTKGKDDRWLNPNLGGGALLDIGIYPLSIIQFILQANPEKIQAQAILSDTGVDVFTAVNFSYRTGAVAQFSTTFLADTQDGLVIIGSKGKITIHENFYMAEEANLEIYGEQPKTFHQKHRSGGFEYQIEEAIACIRSGKIESDVMPHAQSLANMNVMDEIRSQIGVVYPFD